MDTKFYTYIRDSYNRPIVTRCLIITNKGLCLGQAFCHSKEQPVKKIGKAVALARAMTASSMSINTIKFILLRGDNYEMSYGITCPKKPIFSLSPTELNWVDRQVKGDT